ncbi:Glycosyltransferase involved in cell wall bisynthesis [Cyclobacterium lianum]|uniref:Glycosyltransferase involved in cell wall bisynthesis n=1 Tax=Cyclobacterium lianum TaxID=388280 RepID=A0A1M7IMC1_9BACT|nr:glycosyltransferase family 4 protein [Cyclobacterium lianum]SHM41880.1 Glycosyltransferase involved in cell wall bisynthesis [Cyclobacterium lianum]
MKVSIICYNHFDATISLGKYLAKIYPDTVIEFIFILSHDRLNVEIIDLEGFKLGYGFIPESQVSDMISKEVLSYIHPIQLKVFLFNSIKIIDVRNIRLLLSLKRHIVSEKYDLLHFVGNNPWIIMLNFLLNDVPKVHTIHEPYPFEKYPQYHLFKFKSFIRLALYSSNHVTVPSKVSYNRLRENYKVSEDKVSIIPFGALEVFREFLEKEQSKNPKLVLFYGNISNYKGVDVLISAIKTVGSIRSDIQFIIAGAGEFHYDTSGIGKNLRVLNRHLSNREIAELNESASLVVCPYLSASQSGVVMTSFAFGNPILATNVGALPEMVENNVTGMIIAPGNAADLSHAIVDLFQNQTKLQYLRDNVLKRNEDSDNSWSSISRKTYRLYQRILLSKQ